MSDWDVLTDLPRNNGAVYFICALVVRTLRVGSTHRRKNTGCVNDFWNDKRGIDTGMRAGHICTRCVQAFDSNTSKESAVVLDDVQTVLESLGTVSRENRDVCQEEGPEARSFAFDVFMCHNDADKPAVRRVDQRLREAKIVTWLDEDQLPPGTP